MLEPDPSTCWVRASKSPLDVLGDKLGALSVHGGARLTPGIIACRWRIETFPNIIESVQERQLFA
jgi:hypothetical protein